MKKIKKLLMLALVLLFSTGCSLTKDTLENATIYTTIYPIKYLTEYLYEDYGTIKSIYPNGADITTYELTEKQIKEYSKSALFIYNGLSNEKNVAKNLINKNRNLLIIDVSNGLTYTNDIKELWMSPNNYLMLAKNIQANLNEYLTNKTIIDHVNKKYEGIAKSLSLMDADLRSIGKEATNNDTNTIIVSDNALKFLESYGFNVISLDEKTLTDGIFSNIQANFNKKIYSTIFVLDNNITEQINTLVNDENANIIDVKSMTTTESNNTFDYLDTMQEFIDNIRNITLNN